MQITKEKHKNVGRFSQNELFLVEFNRFDS